MSVFEALTIIGVALAVLSIAILMLDDVFAEHDRRRHEDEIFAAARRRMGQRQS